MLPFVKSKHVLIGACTGLLTLVWVVIRAQADIATGVLTFETKETSVEGCAYNFSVSDVTALGNISVHTNESKPLHHISYLYYTPLGTLITIGVAVLSTFVVKSDDAERVDPQLLASFVRKWYVAKDDVKVKIDDCEQIYEFEKVETI